jgi:pimeloyl-ACP methyl ester carboxylesterase
VITPDLPSHRTPTAGLAEDADEVRHAIRASAPPVAAVGWQAAWETTPTTVLIGQRDNMLSEADRKWAEEHLNDVRVIDTDHFIIFRHPDLVAQLVLEAIERPT